MANVFLTTPELVLLPLPLWNGRGQDSLLGVGWVVE